MPTDGGDVLEPHAAVADEVEEPLLSKDGPSKPTLTTADNRYSTRLPCTNQRSVPACKTCTDRRECAASVLLKRDPGEPAQDRQAGGGARQPRAEGTTV